MTSKASATPDPQTGGTDNVALLIDLLKLATFIAGPMRDGVAEPLALSSNDLRVILALGGEGELAGHDLSEIMGVPPMNVSRALASLLERGLVELGSDPANRRRKPFRLSAQGRATFAQHPARHGRKSAAPCSSISTRRSAWLSARPCRPCWRVFRAGWTVTVPPDDRTEGPS